MSLYYESHSPITSLGDRFAFPLVNLEGIGEAGGAKNGLALEIALDYISVCGMISVFLVIWHSAYLD